MEQQSLQSTLPETSPALSVQVAPPEAAQNTVTPELTEALTPDERQLVRTIPRLRNRALRREAENALKQAPPEVLSPLFAALQKPFSRRWREAQVAAWTLGRATLFPEQKQETVEALTRLLQIPVTRKHRFRVTQLVIVAAAIFSLLVAVLTTINDYESVSYYISLDNILVPGIFSVFLFTVFLVPILSPFSFTIDIVLNKRKNRVRATAVAALGRLAAPKSVDVLADTLKDKTPAVHKAALRALVPLLTPAHYGHFGLHVTTALCRALRDKDEMWVLNCLDALEKVGDISAIPAVELLSQLDLRETWRDLPPQMRERMALEKVHDRAALEKIRERATQVLAVLEERKAQDNTPRHLLRASGEPSAAPDILLRAAMGDTSADGTHLLRASTNTEP